MVTELKIDDSIRRIQELIIGRGTGKISPNDENFNNEFATLRKELISSSQIQRKSFPKDLIEIQSLNMFGIRN